MDYSTRLYLMIGGRPGLRPVIERFYELVYADPWIGQFFLDVDQAEQVQALEDFLCTGAPGEPVFDGSYPRMAHAHMYITQPMIKRRTQLLRRAIEDLGHPQEVVHQWLLADGLWHGAVRKESVDDCRPSLAGKALKVINHPED